MEKLKSKIFATILTLLLMASVAMMMLPTNAQDEGVHGGTPQTQVTGGPIPAGVTPSITIETIAYLSFTPNPIGVGQDLLVNLWVQPATNVARAHTGYTVVITKPDGTSTTVGPMVSYTGDTTAWFTYVPEAIGTYTLQFFFAGDYYPRGVYVDGVVNGTRTAYSAAATFNATQDSYYAPSQTAKYNLTVQSEQVFSWVPSPLPGPGDYWTRPISPTNREWWLIGGNDPSSEVGGGTGAPGWPDNTNIYTNNYNHVPYATGPKSAHVVWRRQGALDGIFGGLIDGAYTPYQAPNLMFNNQVSTFQQVGPGQSGNPNIVFEGRAYQAITKPFNGVTQTVWECYDIQTGQIYWDLTNIARIPTLISYAENTPPVPGALGRTDRTIASLVYLGASSVSGTGLVVKYDPMTGAVTLNQTIPLTSGTLYADPFVLSVQNLGGNRGYRLINWTLQGLGSNFTANINSNITWPFSSIGTADYESMIACVTTSSSPPSTGVASNVYIGAADLLTGQLLWNKSADIGYPVFTGSANVADHGKLALRFDDGYYYAWDLRTGNRIWKSELSSYPWGTFGAYAVQSAYGLLFYEQYDGIVAYDWNNGKIVWHFQAPATPFETPYTNGTGNLNGAVYSFFSGGRIAGGVLYAQSAEHSPTAPHIRGWRLFAINATTGEQIWSTPGALAAGVISDGYLTASNYFDGYLYVFGMGQSQTTVSAPQTAITLGTPAIISGTVLDMSPAQPGTPAISETSIGDWMAYLHQQAPCPDNVTGVQVSIDAIDPNNNTVHIATVTSDSSGTFGYSWTPTIKGQYKITATFAGDYSYSRSWAQTYAKVIDAPQTPTNPEIPTPVDNTMLLYGILAAVILAIIIGLAAIALVLRKR